MSQMPPPPPPPGASEPDPEGDPRPSDAATPPTDPHAGAPAAATASDDEKLWAMFCHLSAFAALVGVPFLNVVGPVIIWLIKKEEYPLVDDQGKESVNFQITVTIVTLIIGGATGMLGLVSIFPPALCITFPMMMVAGLATIVVVVAALVMVIIAAIEAQKGVRYRYPYCWRIIQ